MTEQVQMPDEQDHYDVVLAETEDRFRSGVKWFYWVAALSAINSILILGGSDTSFIVGLGITLLIDVFAVHVFQPEMGNAALIIAGVLDIGVAGIFALFGFLALRSKRWPIIVGMVLYGLDALVYLQFQDWLALAFHGWVLFSLFGAYKALNECFDLVALQAANIDMLPSEPAQA